MKKKTTKIVIIALLIILLIQITIHIKDGGTVEYKALLYKVSKVHRLTGNIEKMYEEGVTVEILGLEIFNDVK